MAKSRDFNAESRDFKTEVRDFIGSSHDFHAGVVKTRRSNIGPPSRRRESDATTFDHTPASLMSIACGQARDWFSFTHYNEIESCPQPGFYCVG